MLTVVIPSPAAKREGWESPFLSGFQGEQCITCDGNMKDNALSQQHARTALDLT